MMRKYSLFWCIRGVLHKVGLRNFLLNKLLYDDELCLLKLKFRYLWKIGWIKSCLSGECVDMSGKALPWKSYPYITFIKDRLKASFTLFEYGSGNSTIFYANNVKIVYSVEHNFDWYKKVSNNIPDNVVLKYEELQSNGDYSYSAKNTNVKFDIIVVDGRDRINCIKNSFSAMKDNGILILDNSDRSRYAEAFKFLEKKGFKHIDFIGLLPCGVDENYTTIFYRKENCIGL